jgi:hypothetical protein
MLQEQKAAIFVENPRSCADIVNSTAPTNVFSFSGTPAPRAAIGRSRFDPVNRVR